MLIPLKFLPGVNKSNTGYSQPGRWTDSQWMMWKEGIPETIPGFERLVDTAFLGVGRSEVAWRANTGDAYLGIGTNKRLYAFNNETFTNITPWRSVGTLTNMFITTASSSIVTAIHTAHGVGESGEYVFIGTATTTDQAGVTGTFTYNGLTFGGEYVVTTVIDDNTYSFAASGTATAAGTGGGTGRVFRYELNPGQQDGVTAFGYGAGPYGEEAYGTPRSTGLPLSPRIWQLDVWGENLLAMFKNGSLYEWDVDGGKRAEVVANAPTDNLGFFVTAERQVVVVGANGNPRNVAFSDQEDNTDWTATATNQAGDFVLQAGNQLITGRRMRGGVNLIFADTEAFTQRYTADRFVFAFERAGSGAGLIAPNAVVEFEGVMYWMGNRGFYAFNGFVQEMPAVGDIRDYVFGDINESQKEKCWAGTDAQNRIIWFAYPSAASTEIDRYVIFHVREGVWATGEWPSSRTAWADADVFSNPIAAGFDGYLYQHNVGDDGDGTAIEKSLEAAPIDMDKGNSRFDLSGVIPDMKDQAGTVEMTLLCRDKPNSDVEEFGPYDLDPDTERVDIRADGRQAGMRLVSNEMGGRFRLGEIRIDVDPSGVRP